MPLVTDATGNDLTYRIIGAAMAVHNELGHGFEEEVYEKALEARLNRDGIPVERHTRFTLNMKGSRWPFFI